MMYEIFINGEKFDITGMGAADRIFSYCENLYSFSGKDWEEIKAEFDWESMGELIQSRGGEYQEIIE